MEIYRISALSDNYIFLLHDRDRHIAAVVDPAEPKPVLHKLQELDSSLVKIFNTHHHSDHVGANQHLLTQFPTAVIYGGAQDKGRIPGQTVFLNAGDEVEFADRKAKVLFVPGHTRAHIAYYFYPVNNEPGELFCGDTLFAGGCGRLFEGTPDQMVDSLDQIRALPDDTRVWCAHEYTLKNLKFALSVDPKNLDLKLRFSEVESLRSRHESTIPSSLGLEKRTNPFLGWDRSEIQQAMGKTDAIATFAALRQKRNSF